jgi:murein DD-endopeptidase MepM/ murein hydrolase activator NlpD
VQGPKLSGFGPKGQGVNNDGVNIGAPKGSPVVAAANGIVVYAGDDMKGFGNLVLIRHEGGWVTAYTYLDRVLVAKDAVVAQGDMIGTVGKSGNISSPQLHFETRHDGKAVDPDGVIK